MEQLFTHLFGSNRVLMGIFATLITGFATGVGALPVLFTATSPTGCSMRSWGLLLA